MRSLSFIGLPILRANVNVNLGEEPLSLPTVNNWMVIMNRVNEYMNFSRNWGEYKQGFSSPPLEGDMFWLGNELVHSLSIAGGLGFCVEVFLNLHRNNSVSKCF